MQKSWEQESNPCYFVVRSNSDKSSAAEQIIVTNNVLLGLLSLCNHIHIYYDIKECHSIGEQFYSSQLVAVCCLAAVNAPDIDLNFVSFRESVAGDRGGGCGCLTSEQGRNGWLGSSRPPTYYIGNQWPIRRRRRRL